MPKQDNEKEQDTYSYNYGTQSREEKKNQYCVQSVALLPCLKAKLRPAVLTSGSEGSHRTK